MKNIDCPLCGAKNVILYKEPEPVTHVIPAPAGSVGNYSTGYQGGGYDLFHAEVCPKLEGVIDKRSLLEFYVTGEPQIVKADLHSFEDYQHVLSKIHVKLTPTVVRNNGAWEFSVFAYSTLVGFRNLETTTKNIDKAFDLFRHRILCGEKILVDRILGCKDVFYQIKKESKSLEFIEV